MNCTAIRFYGLVYEDEGVLPWLRSSGAGYDLPESETSEELETRLGRLLGCPLAPPKVSDAFRANLNDPLLRKAFTEGYREYGEARAALLKENFGPHKLVLVTYSTGDHPYYGIAVASTVARVRLGTPVRLDSATPEDAVGWEALKRACDVLGMDFNKDVDEGRLGWWLVSAYSS